VSIGRRYETRQQIQAENAELQAQKEHLKQEIRALEQIVGAHDNQYRVCQKEEAMEEYLSDRKEVREKAKELEKVREQIQKVASIE